MRFSVLTLLPGDAPGSAGAPASSDAPQNHAPANPAPRSRRSTRRPENQIRKAHSPYSGPTGVIFVFDLRVQPTLQLRPSYAAESLVSRLSREAVTRWRWAACSCRPAAGIQRGSSNKQTAALTTNVSLPSLLSLLSLSFHLPIPSLIPPRPRSLQATGGGFRHQLRHPQLAHARQRLNHLSSI